MQATTHLPDAAPVTSQSETHAGRRIREIRQSALNMIQHALSSPYITAQQRIVATAKADACHNMTELLQWHQAVVNYVAALKAGSRQPKADVAQVVPTPPQPATPEERVPVVMAVAPKRPVIRPARRMTARQFDRWRTARQKRRQQEQFPTQPAPMWAETPQLSALPGGLYWSGKGEVPGLGDVMMVRRDGGLSGKATVKGYFHAEGFLGVVADFEKVPQRYKKSPRSRFLFGREVPCVA